MRVPPSFARTIRRLSNVTLSPKTKDKDAPKSEKDILNRAYLIYRLILNNYLIAEVIHFVYKDIAE